MAEGLEINVSSRYDAILDFTDTRIGQQIYVLNNQSMHVSTPEPAPINGVDLTKGVLRFDVVSDPPYPDNSQVPDVLTTYPSFDLPSEVAATRVWEFAAVGAPAVFKVNQLVFCPTRADATVKLGTAETWILHNKTGTAAWTHPVHIHFEEGRILKRNNDDPAPLESGRRDVYTLHAGGEKILLFMRFRNFSGKYMIHCHNMIHEDNFMIARWDIGDVTSPTTSGLPNLNPPITDPNDPRYINDQFLG